jgi:PAS domain S-box-containing protein
MLYSPGLYCPAPGEAAGISISDSEARRFKLLRIYCEGSAIATIGMATVVLVGWAFGVEVLTSVLPGLVTMKVNTALGLGFSGISVWLQLPGKSRSRKSLSITRYSAHVLALLVVLIGAGTLAEYLFGVNLGIDQLLFRDPMGSVGTSSPGRPAPMTGIAFIASGLALVLLDRKTKRGSGPAQGLSLWSGLIGLMAITGYVYQASLVSKIFLYTKVALNTAIGLFLVSSAVFFARPRVGLAGDLTGDGAGSVVARRFLPAIVLIPILLGWICLRGEIAGMYGMELGLGLQTTVNIVVFAALVWWNARRLNKEYDQRSQAEVEIRALNAALERRVAERTKSLELLSERLSLATAIARVGVWEWELVGKMSIWDATMFEIYGFPPVVPVPYEKWSAAVLPEDLPAAEANLQRSIAEKNQGSAEFRIGLPDGSVRNISVIQKAILDDQASVTRLIGVNMDITERKRAQEALEQGAKDQLRFKDEFLSHVSHELRSPLTAIKQFTTILLSGLAGELNKEQREYQQIVLKNIRQLQSMIDDLLDVTRAEAGKLSVEPESTSAWDAVTDSLNTLRVSSEGKGVSLVSELPPDLPPVHADQTRLRQILIILLDNALKFTPKGGAVRVRARLQKGDAWFVVLEVSDTGCGMSPEACERVFERLFQVEQPSQASRKGLGLGLFICKELVTRQGGEIWVQSEPQVGSTFSFTLPVFSLNNVIAPLLKDDRWPAESVALVMAEICFGGGGSLDSQQECRHEIRNLVQRCLLPNLDVLLPKMSYGAEGERFFIAAFADEKGASILAKRIRDQFECIPHLRRTNLTLLVTYTMLKPFPLEGGSSQENMVTTMATSLENTIKSQILSEGVS